MRFFYDALLLLFSLLLAPRVLYLYQFRKKYRKSLPFRLGWKAPDIPEKKGYRIWIHAVSLGEAKAATKLFEEIQKQDSKIEILFSAATETGHQEGLKKTPHTFFLPLDFSFLMKKLVRQVDPDLFILVETDFWPNLLRELKKHGTKVALINGKLSPRSYKQFQKITSFAKNLFSFIDILCLQSEEDKKRFLALGVTQERVYVTGNIKFDTKKEKSQLPLAIQTTKQVVTIALTHDKEEEMILEELMPLIKTNTLLFLLAPRHPERFEVVANLLKKKQIPFARLEEPKTGQESILLIDKIGVMESCYQASKAAIIGGSFVTTVGGHNIYEPAMYNIPVIYGEHMHKQQALVALMKKHKIGRQVALGDLKKTLENVLIHNKTSSIEALKAEVEGATERSWKFIKQAL